MTNKLSEVIEELDEVIALIEARLPANPMSSKNQNFAENFEKDLRKYFKNIEDSFPFQEIEKIYLRRAGE